LESIKGNLSIIHLRQSKVQEIIVIELKKSAKIASNTLAAT
jgi:hypothetical protein